MTPPTTAPGSHADTVLLAGDGSSALPFLFCAVLTLALVFVVLPVLVAKTATRRRPATAAAFAATTLFAAVYLWGLLHLGSALLSAGDGGTDSSPPRPCRSAGVAVANHVTSYHADFLPLRFVCARDDAPAYTAPTVPAWVNPTLLALAAVAAVGGTTEAVRRRRTPAAPPQTS